MCDTVEFGPSCARCDLPFDDKRQVRRFFLNCMHGVCPSCFKVLHRDVKCPRCYLPTANVDKTVKLLMEDAGDAIGTIQIPADKIEAMKADVPRDVDETMSLLGPKAELVVNAENAKSVVLSLLEKSEAQKAVTLKTAKSSLEDAYKTNSSSAIEDKMKMQAKLQAVLRSLETVGDRIKVEVLKRTETEVSSLISSLEQFLFSDLKSLVEELEESVKTVNVQAQATKENDIQEEISPKVQLCDGQVDTKQTTPLFGERLQRQPIETTTVSSEKKNESTRLSHQVYSTKSSQVSLKIPAKKTAGNVAQAIAAPPSDAPVIPSANVGPFLPRTCLVASPFFPATIRKSFILKLMDLFGQILTSQVLFAELSGNNGRIASAIGYYFSQERQFFPTYKNRSEKHFEFVVPLILNDYDPTLDYVRVSRAGDVGITRCQENGKWRLVFILENLSPYGPERTQSSAILIGTTDCTKIKHLTVYLTKTCLKIGIVSWSCFVPY